MNLLAINFNVFASLIIINITTFFGACFITVICSRNAYIIDLIIIDEKRLSRDHCCNREYSREYDKFESGYHQKFQHFQARY